MAKTCLKTGILSGEIWTILLDCLHTTCGSLRTAKSWRKSSCLRTGAWTSALLARATPGNLCPATSAQSGERLERRPKSKNFAGCGTAAEKCCGFFSSAMLKYQYKRVTLRNWKRPFLRASARRMTGRTMMRPASGSCPRKSFWPGSSKAAWRNFGIVMSRTSPPGTLRGNRRCPRFL